jgi:hypothetical protein
MKKWANTAWEKDICEEKWKKALTCLKLNAFNVYLCIYTYLNIHTRERIMFMTLQRRKRFIKSIGEILQLSKNKIKYASLHLLWLFVFYFPLRLEHICECELYEWRIKKTWEREKIMQYSFLNLWQCVGKRNTEWHVKSVNMPNLQMFFCVSLKVSSFRSLINY